MIVPFEENEFQRPVLPVYVYILMFTVLIYQHSKSNWICLIENPKFSIYSSLYAASTACCCILCQTHCVPLITYLEFRVLARNTSETPRDRWHYEANAGWSACVVVLLWRKRSGLATSMTRRRFPGVSNGRHQISSQPFFNFCQEVLWYGRCQIRRSTGTVQLKVSRDLQLYT